MSAGRRERLRWAVIDAAIWCGIALLFTMQAIVSHQGEPVPVGRVLMMELAGWTPCALLTPAVAWIALRYRFTGDDRVTPTLVHLGGAVTFVIVGGFMMGCFEWLLPWQRRGPMLTYAGAAMLRYFVWDLLIYALIVTAFQAAAFSRDLREREVASAQLQAQLADARLHVLTAQLQPHFLFNTLHAISALVHDDPKQADRLLARLSDLLRHALRSGTKVETTLDEELTFLEKYVDIQEARFGDRLRVTFQVDHDVSDARVPRLLLQPLVENAIRHGIGGRSARGSVELTARQENGTLFLAVRDDGVGFPADGSFREGIGLSTTRARLRQLYGDNHDFALSNRPGGGATVTLRIPYRTISGTGT
jgi:signal transduction histidine kinase